VLLSEQEWPSAERERVVSKGEDTDQITTCISDVREKGDPGWQSKETHPTSITNMAVINNGLCSPLLIGH
jgi:hypothetical protein